MTRSPDVPKSAAPPRRLSWQFSTPLIVAACTTVSAGVLSGGATYLARSSVREPHSSATAAWWPHLALAVAATLLFVLARRRWRSSGRSGPLLLGPLSEPAWRRLRETLRTSPLRAVLATPLIVLIAYNGWRAGVQVLGGLDPNFTANAWGGPTYAGAMFCHYLDLALITAAATWLLNHTLVPTSHHR